MTVTGLSSDLYFSDFPIYVKFEGIRPNIEYITVSALAFPLIPGEVPPPLKLFFNKDSNSEYDISPIVKALFKQVENNTDYTTIGAFPIANNWVKINFLFTEVTSVFRPTVSAVNIVKTFVKGGIREGAPSNQNTQINKILSPIDIVPTWGLPVSYNYFNEDKVIVKNRIIPNSVKEIRKVKGCYYLYLKFRNSQGGYSYWLFESYSDNYQNIPLGYSSNRDGFYDFGNDERIEIEASSKVPRRFHLLMADLIISPEVYLYKKDSNTWEQIKNKSNKISQNLHNPNEKVKVKFERILKYNPSELW